jgi:hypothetical protein
LKRLSIAGLQKVDGMLGSDSPIGGPDGPATGLGLDDLLVSEAVHRPAPMADENGFELGSQELPKEMTAPLAAEPNGSLEPAP